MKIKVLWIGDGGVSTGFARVNKEIIENLPEEKYEIHQLAINYFGDPHDVKNARLYPATLGGDYLGVNRVKTLYEIIAPDLVFILNDVWVIPKYLNLLPESAKIVTYFPVDSGPLYHEWCDKMVEMTTPVAYTEYGKKVFIEGLNKNKDLKNKIKIIPHGVNTNIFYPIDSKVARASVGGLNCDDFIILNANRNQPRKRIDLTIKGFALFAKNKPKNVKLYLHMGIQDSGWNLLYLGERYNILNRLILTSLDLSPASGIPDKRMNIIYNCSDVGINTSTGEGWGLCSFEHAACGKPQIVPASSANLEIYKDCARFIPIDHYDTNPGCLTEGAVVSPEEVAKALDYYYNEEKRLEDGAKMLALTNKEKYNWKNIAKQWDSVFEEVLSK